MGMAEDFEKAMKELGTGPVVNMELSGDINSLSTKHMQNQLERKRKRDSISFWVYLFTGSVLILSISFLAISLGVWLLYKALALFN